MFIDAILHKFNHITGRCQKQDSGAQEAYQSIEKSILSLTKQFFDEMNGFKSVLEKHTGLTDNKITVTPRFHPKVVIENSLAMRLIELLETYDNLTATLKLLNLAGCFESKQDYYANATRIQKQANRALSKLIT